MNKYQKGKEKARQEAIDFSLRQGDMIMSWQDVADYSNYFERLGRRYGLLQEFHENGIC